jgi:hypothetical protein
MVSSLRTDLEAFGSQAFPGHPLENPSSATGNTPGVIAKATDRACRALAQHLDA